MSVCAVIPAAGLGSRLGMSIPKIFLPISESQTVWSILHAKIITMVQHVHVVVSPAALPMAKLVLNVNDVSFSVQQKPLGMGDALFQCHEIWQKYDVLLLIWGDQVFVSCKTMHDAITVQNNLPQTVCVPLIKVSRPYVEYIFTQGKLMYVMQSREGDRCMPNGLSDVGTFVVSTRNLLHEWQQYLKQKIDGRHTKEINFLPFLPYLAGRAWQVIPSLVADAREARGINTKEDLTYYQKLFAEVNK